MSLITVDPRDVFENVFPIPKHVIRCGNGYACTEYNAWGAHDFIQKWEGWSAAMLQGADGTLINEGTMPATLFKPVSDLYGITSPTGSETSFTFDAVEARDFIEGGWSCQEYVKLEKYQEFIVGNSPVITDELCPCCGRKQLKNRKCSVAGCEGKHVAHGFCKKHYDIEHKKDPSRRDSIRAADERYRARKTAAPKQEVE